MSTASPPRPPLRSPEPSPGPPNGPVPTRPPRSRARMLAFGALALVIVVLGLVIFSGSNGADYRLVFADANQLVRGDQVQVGGVPVGQITDIVLTPDYRALVTIHVESSLTPLHAGTTAQIRVPSLSGVASRYIALAPGPNNNPALPEGATLPASAAHGVTDLDQLFNLFNAQTRRGLQQVIQGSAEQYAGAGPALYASTPYLSPAFAAITHVFSELSSDQRTLREFLVQTAKATTVLAAHRESLTGLVEHGNTAFQAAGAEQANLEAGLKQLPVTLNAGNRTFAELPPTFAALRRLVDVSKPDTKTLAPFLAALRPLLIEATPVFGNLAQAIDRPGPNNDLTDVALALPGLAQSLATASPNTVAALRASIPIVSYIRAYTPELVGLTRSLGQTSSYYDANGHYVRASLGLTNLKPDAEGNLKPTENLLQALENLKTGQLNRCPGAAASPPADGSAPFTEEGRLGCNPSETH